MPDLLKNFVRGAGTVLELLPSRPSRFDSDKRLRTSTEALASDWRRVGDHLRSAIDRATKKPHRNGTT